MYNLKYLLLILLLAIAAFFVMQPKTETPIRIGVLHSLTGTMATSERPLVDAVKLAVDELNSQGGLLGKKIEVVIADGKSDPAVFATEAERLITQEKVSVIFGCWTSSSRKAVKFVVEKYNHLLFYPLQYEGLEQSPNIIYTGLVPNQQIVPTIRWALTNLGKRAYFIGSDYIFPRTANRIMADFIQIANAQLLAERYLPLGSDDVEKVINEIETLKPDVIFNTINGDSNVAFFKALSQSSAKNTAVVSFSISENELKNYSFIPKHYAAWSYFQSIDSVENQRFVANYKKFVGDETRVTSDPIEAAYSSVYLWAQTVKEINAFTPQNVNESVIKQSFHAPSGIISIDALTRHTWKMSRIGHSQENGQFKEIYHSELPLRPSPFPNYHSHSEWTDIISSLDNGERHD